MEEISRQTQVKQWLGRAIRFDVLPDDVLLEIFDFYTKNHTYYGDRWRVEAWQSLVHVCRRWRTLVLRSPRRLELRLFCTPQTPAKDNLDVWPAFPLIIEGDMLLSSGTDNVIAALGHSNRVCQVILWDLAGWQLEQVSAAMQVPFPDLTHLRLLSDGKTVPVVPDSFLGGSAPLLEYVELSGVPFPALPNLVLSATYLVDLKLSDIPYSGYMSPEAIVAVISVLSCLETLLVEFQSPQSVPDRDTRRLPPSKRSVIPALLRFTYKGVTEYLEDFVTGIDTPQLDNMQITFFNQIDFDTPRLAQFINRTPKLEKRDAIAQFHDEFAVVGLSPGTLGITISCREPDWQLSSTEQVCNSSLYPLSSAEHLYIEHKYRKLVWKPDAIENTLWLQLLLPFTALKNLYLSKEFALGIAVALQELEGDRIIEVLPSLENIFVEWLEPFGPFEETIAQFIAARQLSNHPIAVSDWDKDSDWDERYYEDNWDEDFDGDNWNEDSDVDDSDEDSDVDDSDEDSDRNNSDKDSDVESI